LSFQHTPVREHNAYHNRDDNVNYDSYNNSDDDGDHNGHNVLTYCHTNSDAISGSECSTVCVPKCSAIGVADSDTIDISDTITISIPECCANIHTYLCTKRIAKCISNSHTNRRSNFGTHCWPNIDAKCISDIKPDVSANKCAQRVSNGKSDGGTVIITHGCTKRRTDECSDCHAISRTVTRTECSTFSVPDGKPVSSSYCVTKLDTVCGTQCITVVITDCCTECSPVCGSFERSNGDANARSNRNAICGTDRCSDGYTVRCQSVYFWGRRPMHPGPGWVVPGIQRLGAPTHVPKWIPRLQHRRGV